MNLGKRIKELREKEKLSREALAEKIGITYWSLSKYETGKREPDIDTLQKIADFFMVTLDYLTGRVDDPHGRIKFDDEVLAFHRTDDPMDDLPAEALEEVERFKDYIRHKYADRFKEKGE